MYRKADFDTMLEALDSEGRDFVMVVLRGEYDRVTRPARARRLRSHLTVVGSDAIRNLVNDEVDAPSVVRAG
jgi:hypothetical protein